MSINFFKGHVFFPVISVARRSSELSLYNCVSVRCKITQLKVMIGTTINSYTALHAFGVKLSFKGSNNRRRDETKLFQTFVYEFHTFYPTCIFDR